MSVSMPWKTRGLVLTAPLPKDVETVCEFIEKILAGKINLLVLQTRYRYQFKTHPECTGRYALSEKDVKRILSACRNAKIELIPKMNLFGHQSGLPNVPDDGILHGAPDDRPTIKDGLLAAYPEFDEEQNNERVLYSRSICPTHPRVKGVLSDLIGELLDVFEARAIHIGCDEAFSLGTCPRCAKVGNARLFADWITSIHDLIAARGAKTFMWSDRFLNSEKTYRNIYEASANGTEGALALVPKDIILCDWHYENYGGRYPSLEIFKNAGFQTLISPWKNLENAKAFVRAAAQSGYKNIAGVLLTTWCSSGELARHFLYGAPCVWQNTPQIAETLRALYLDNDLSDNEL